MSEMLDYSSRIEDPASRKFETFSYLPEMTEEQAKKQIQYIIDQGWDPAIEHCEPAFSRLHYWYMWKLPMFGETSVDTVWEELLACHKANPDHHVRLIGYNKYKQSQGLSFVVFRGPVPTGNTTDVWLHLKNHGPDWVMN